MASVEGKVKAAADLDCRFRLGWDDRGLLVLITVHDDFFIEDDDLETLWQKDCVEHSQNVTFPQRNIVVAASGFVPEDYAGQGRGSPRHP